MRTIRKIIVHCSDTPAGRHHTVADFRKWHTDPPPYGNGWNDIGYQVVTYLDGSNHAGRPEEIAGAHTYGHNHDSLGICYVGGRASDGSYADTRTPEQKAGLLEQINIWLVKYPTIVEIGGHRDYDARECPCFDARGEYAHLLGNTPAPIDSITTDPNVIQAYKWPSIGTPVAEIPPSTTLPVTDEITKTWYKTEKGWVSEDDII